MNGLHKMPFLVTTCDVKFFPLFLKVTWMAKETMTYVFGDASSSCLTTTSCHFMGDWKRGWPAARIYIPDSWASFRALLSVNDDIS